MAKESNLRERRRRPPRPSLRDRLAAARAARGDVRAGIYDDAPAATAVPFGFISATIDTADRQSKCRRRVLHETAGPLEGRLFQASYAMLDLRDRECVHLKAGGQDRLTSTQARAVRSGDERSRMGAQVSDLFGQWAARCAAEEAAAGEAIAEANQLLGHYEKVRDRRLGRAAKKRRRSGDASAPPRPGPVARAQADAEWRDPVGLLGTASDDDARKVVRDALRLLAPELPPTTNGELR
ncbi:hypothetical protein [Actinomadura sp. DC4]|uniref:hypothetical protein n=1 Tax=Actinomadura sp. DC4 TaxID=3055069 RepID=UPI0025B19432|nr:hypothetical protein [Actinomadura sp. DC4]MDN3353852.1 hypothetical protein [Actinomadura sp. DC4]